ncbi:uncharacterized protein Dwil_GK14295 [Drosophila willistoni]|uniref:Uncharacterized protein n=1 Tax=Drosophila willistoni TaxID=7260 RepID=B4NI82_DROWI|nr:uncharacterized protein Dwil_GK14295 [Drosophila willistoni]
MLIKSNSKSFDLINEEKATKPQQPERLYQPRRLSWMKYIVIPTGIAFILLLILCNVDFSEHHTCIGKEINSTNCTNVTEYDKNSFNNMPMLEDLNLGDCGLKSMELNTLGENVLNSLMYLDLSENNITSLTEDFIQALWDNNIDLETHATTTTTQGFVAFTPGNATDTSPYNCRSYRTGDCKQYGQDLSWFQNYFVMIISLGIVGILISVSLGIFMIYIILRLKPNWMKGSNRLIRPLRDSQTMFLLPRLTELGIPNRIKNDYDYINYYRRLERIKQCPPDSLKDNTPPKERAPSIPPSVSSSYNAASPTNSTSYLYETFELYEELP